MSEQLSSIPETAPAPAPEAVAPVSEAPAPSVRDSMEAVWDKLNPPRENGKFVAHEAETPAEAVETGAPETPGQPEEQAPVEPAAPAIDAPHSWPAEMKAQWGKVPPEVGEYIAKREADAHRMITQQGEAVKAFQPFTELVNAYRDDFAKQNVKPVEGISYLLNMNRRFVANPASVLMELAENEGIDLAQLAEYSRSQPQRDPEVLELKRELGELKSHMTAAQRARHDAEMATAARQLEEFGKDRPFFADPDVQQHMGVLLESGRASSLDDAYDQATHAIPSVSERIQTDQRKADEAKRAKEAAERATAAKKAAGVTVRSGQGANPAKPKSMRESMEAAYDRVNG